MLDSSLYLRYINHAGEMLFAASANRLCGRKITALFERDPQLAEALRETLKNSQSVTIREAKLSLPGHDQQMLVDLTTTPLFTGKVATHLLIELTRADRYQRLSRDEELIERHTANRAIIKGLAHEIKNPLGGLRGAAQLLEKELSDRSLKEYTYIIIKEADRLRNLVDRMLSSTRPLKQEPVNIHQVFNHVRKIVQAENHDGQLTIYRDFDPSLPTITGDNDQLIQAILNIIRNSIQALNGKGEIIMRTRIERQLTLGQKRYRLVLRAEVEDNGPGIPPALLEKIFYPMVTGHADGTGLGLSIAQDIVSNHKGLIECQSRPGQTIFSIFLPLEDNHE